MWNFINPEISLKALYLYVYIKTNDGKMTHFHYCIRSITDEQLAVRMVNLA